MTKLHRDPNVPESDHLKRLQRLVLYLERCRNSGRLQAKVDVLHPTSFTVEDRAAADEINNSLGSKRQPPPEILMQTPPTEEETIELFQLCLKQALDFRIIARTLMAEKNGEKIRQLRMVISGQAGTGKSEIMKAVIWYAFQHNMSRLIGVFSYQWKAAILVRTEQCPAVSSCAFFGLNTVNRRYNNPGHGESCERNFNADVRLLWGEEFGTTSIELMVVSVLSNK